VDGGSTATSVYDALNHQVSTKTVKAAYESIFDANGRVTSNWVTPTFADEGHIFWDNKEIAFRSQDGQTFFEHKDWLQTDRIHTDPNGVVAASFTSLPFGDGGTPTVSQTYGGLNFSHFGDMDDNSESSTYHAQFRQYNPTQGRWMRPDPYSGSYNVGNPQSFNRYTYASNNPMALMDPSGLDPCGGNGTKADSVHARPHAMDDGDCWDGGDGSGGGGDGGGGSPDCSASNTVCVTSGGSDCSDGSTVCVTADPPANCDTNVLLCLSQVPAVPILPGTFAPNSGPPQPQHFWQKPCCGSAIGQTALGLAGSAVEVGAVIFVGPELLAAAGAEAGGAALLEGGELVESGMSVAHVATGLGTLLAAPAVLTANGTMGIFKNCF
jgi:RHS repeat-associated protein